MSTKTELLHVITKRLIFMTLATGAVVVMFFGATLFLHQRLMISWLCFGCGLLGGFISIQQRVKNLSDEELELLARSWFQILLIPVYGGLFSVVLYVAFLSQVIQGDMFPRFAIAPFTQPFPTTDDMIGFLSQTYPATGQDLAKLLFWSFVAGFSERFVPQILDRKSGESK